MEEICPCSPMILNKQKCQQYVSKVYIYAKWYFERFPCAPEFGANTPFGQFRSQCDDVGLWSQEGKNGLAVTVGGDQRKKVKLGALCQKCTERSLGLSMKLMQVRNMALIKWLNQP